MYGVVKAVREWEPRSGARVSSMTKRLAVGAALLAAGCGLFRSAPPPPAPLQTIEKPIPVRVLWQANIGRAKEAAFAPAVAAGSVFAAAEDGTVVRLESATGRELWRVKLPRQLSGGVGSDGRLVVVGSFHGEVIALDNDGRMRWRARVSSEVLAPPVVTSELVVVRSADGRVFALDANDGRRRWLYQRAAPPLAVRSPAGLVVREGYVFAGFAGGKLVALALNNGGLRWEGTVSLPRGTTELERVSDVIGFPWIGQREACAVAFQGRVACFDLGNGQLMWGRDMSSAAGLGVDAASVYVSEDRGAVSALDRTTGTSLWRQDKLANRWLSAPLPLGDEIAVGDLQGNVHFLARDTGMFIGRATTDGSPIRTAPVPLENAFLVQTSAGNLYALSTR